MNKNLSLLYDWSLGNRLTINPHKTKCVLFNYSHNFVRPQSMTIHLNQTHISMVDKYLYLGVVLDQDLMFVPHISSVTKRCNQKVFLLSKIRRFVTDHIALKLYKSLFLSIIDYGDILYDGADKKNLTMSRDYKTVL